MRVRGNLYRAARLLGDLNALRRGRIVQRLANKLIGRQLRRFWQ